MRRPNQIRRSVRGAVLIGVASLLIAGTLIALTPAGLRAPARTDLLITNAIVLDAKTFTPATSLLIRNGRIAEIDSSAKDPLPFDAGGRYVTPGLVDAHTHMLRAGRCGRDEGIAWSNVAQIPMNFDVALRSGNTTVVDLGGPLAGVLQLKRTFADEGSLAPRFVVAGPVLTAPNGYPLDWADRELVIDELDVVVELPDEATAVRTVERLAAAGVDLIKIATMERAYNDRPLPTLAPAVFRAAVAAAHQHRLRVFVHAHSDAGYRAALDAGADVIAHSAFDMLGDDTILRVATSSVVVLPTLWVFASFDAALEDPTVLAEAERQLVPGLMSGLRDFDGRFRASEDEIPDDFLPGLRVSRLREGMSVARDNLRRLAARGVTIGYGTDSSFCYGLHGAAHRELGQMVQAGLTPRQAFAAATLGSARALGRTDLGVIEVGAAADLLVLDRNPMEDSEALEHPFAVIRDGRVLTAEAEAPGVLRTARVMFGLLRAFVFGASES